ADFAATKSLLAAAHATQQALDKSACDQKIEHEKALATARESQTAAESQLTGVRAQLAHEQSAHAGVKARCGEIEKSLAEFREAAKQYETTAATLREQRIVAEKACSDLDAKVTFLNERLTTERAEVQKVHETFRKEFEAISNGLMVKNAEYFKQQSSESLDKILSPLRENLKDFRSRLEEAYKDSATQNAVLKDQISRIGNEAANLARALKGDVKVLGNWGEHRLEQILEKSGLQLGVHYERQHAATDLEAEQRRFLDVIVKVPNDRAAGTASTSYLIIDSKVSLTNYEAHINGADDAVRALHLDKHIESIRKHVKDLAGKRYQDLYGINAPDFVLMYIPLESAFFAAVAHEPDLFAEALDKNVVLITNSTLLATLRTVAHVWRLAAQQENAAEIARRGGALYDKFVGFVADLDDLGKSIGVSQRTYDEAIKKLHQGKGNLVRQAEDLKSLGAKASKSLPTPLLEKAREGESEVALLN
ncbi:MAG TPA: DNA recombination protein RmuC, partial [Candidatus Acidoferrum sp.]|nr:DNA recombination protein RmuC [Candidatus Acidoferrum sp.]